MLKISLSRTGRKNQAYFRIVVTKKGQDVWGRTIANLGNYNPRTKVLVIDKEETLKFIKNGAQPTDTVHNLLITNKIIEGKKRSVTNLTTKKRAAIEDEKKKAEEEKIKAEEARKAAEEKAKADAEAAKAAETAAKAAAEATPVETPAPEATSEATPETSAAVEAKADEPAA